MVSILDKDRHSSINIGQGYTVLPTRLLTVHFFFLNVPSIIIVVLILDKGRLFYYIPITWVTRKYRISLYNIGNSTFLKCTTITTVLILDKGSLSKNTRFHDRQDVPQSRQCRVCFKIEEHVPNIHTLFFISKKGPLICEHPVLRTMLWLHFWVGKKNTVWTNIGRYKFHMNINFHYQYFL